MSIVHRITGYNRTTDLLVEQHEVPPRLLQLAKNLARVARDDPNAIWSYPMSVDQVCLLASAMRIALDTQQNEYFLEAFAAADSQAQPARSRAM